MYKYKVHLTTDEGELLFTREIEVYSDAETAKFLSRLEDDLDEDIVDIVSEKEIRRERGPFPLFEDLAIDIQSEINKHILKD